MLSSPVSVDNYLKAKEEGGENGTYVKKRRRSEEQKRDKLGQMDMGGGEEGLRRDG